MISTATQDWWVKHAEQVATASYGSGVNVSVDAKAKDLLKFGKNDGLQAADEWETVWNQGGNETYTATNSINRVVSTGTDDDQTLLLEYHTLGSDGFTFGTQEVTLEGQDEVTLSVPCARVSRIYNNTANAFAGTVYVYESGGTVTSGVPQDASKIHLLARADDQQSQKCAATFSKDDFAIVTSVHGFVNRNSSASVDFQLQVRLYEKQFRTVFSFGAHSNGSNLQLPLRPMLIIPPNSDVRIRANSSANSTSAEASFNALLAKFR